MDNNTIIIETEKQQISINDGAKKQYYVVVFLSIITVFNGTILSLNDANNFISKMGIFLAVLGVFMLGFFFFKLNYQETLTFAEIDQFYIKNKFGKDQPIFKLKNGKIRRVFKPIPSDVIIDLQLIFNK
jgi:hypothetical protein